MKVKTLSIEEQEARFRQSLKVVPFRNASAVIHPGAGLNEIEVEVELRYEGVFMKFFQRFFKLRTKKRYLLEGVGKIAFEAIDGKKNFEQLIDEFAEKEKLTFFESRALLGQYFQTLTRRGLIIPTVSGPQASKD